MKNLVIKGTYLLSFCMFISCGKSEKQKKEAHQGKEGANIENNIEETKPKNIVDLIADSFYSGKEVNEKLGGLLDIKKVSIIKDPKSDEIIYIAFLLDKEITENTLTNYKFILKMFPYEEDRDLLREDTKKSNRNYDSWYFKPQLSKIGEVSFLYKIINTTIVEYEQIYIQLYNINEEKIVEKSIVVRGLGV